MWGLRSDIFLYSNNIIFIIAKYFNIIFFFTILFELIIIICFYKSKYVLFMFLLLIVVILTTIKYSFIYNDINFKQAQIQRAILYLVVSLICAAMNLWLDVWKFVFSDIIRSIRIYIWHLFKIEVDLGITFIIDNSLNISNISIFVGSLIVFLKMIFLLKYYSNIDEDKLNELVLNDNIKKEIFWSWRNVNLVDFCIIFISCFPLILFFNIFIWNFLNFYINILLFLIFLSCNFIIIIFWIQYYYVMYKYIKKDAKSKKRK